MSLRQRALLAILAGAFAAFGQEPYALAPAIVFGMALAIWLWHRSDSPRASALIGWAFGLGYFAHTLQWIVSPFMVDVARHGWMAPFALAFMAAGMALFWGAAFWGARKLSATKWMVVLTWAAAELTRGYIFTGFPWAMPAQAFVGTMFGQGLALIGPYALNLVLIAVAVLLAEVCRRQGFIPSLVLGIPFLLAFSLRVVWPDAGLTEHTVRLIQPNAAQRDKWDPEKIPVFFDRQLQFTQALPEAGGPPPDLVLWSESAVPWALDMAGSTLAEMAQAGGTAQVAFGIQRREGARYFNSMVALDRQGGVDQVYDKHHLVPFGEYIPLGDLAGRLGLTAFAAQFGNGYSAGPGPKLMDFGPLGRALPLICYEAVFAHDVNAAPARPDFLIQITNDAWFGKGAGPRQHLAQARMRAIEQGLPLARAANTGISAMIDPRGRVLASLPLNQAGFVDAPLPAPLPPTLYSRTGDLPLAVLLLLALGAVRLRGRRASRIDQSGAQG
ncbi:MAG: apolipoprotein N-acyltransferase [Pseudomonadota bacterium]